MAGADRNGEIMPGMAQRHAGRQRDHLAHRRQPVARRTGQQDHEFVAANTGDAGIRPGRRRQSFRYRHDQRITRIMAGHIVGLFQKIDIDGDHVDP